MKSRQASHKFGDAVLEFSSSAEALRYMKRMYRRIRSDIGGIPLHEYEIAASQIFGKTVAYIKHGHRNNYLGIRRVRGYAPMFMLFATDPKRHR